jgi:sugar transferase (PEP-CTERM/EpsH1 system associated)
MARVLVISPRLPYPLTGGSKIRIFNIARILAEEYTVDLLVINNGNAKQEQVDPIQEKFNEINVFDFPSYRFYLNTIPGLFSQLPVQCHYFSFQAVHQWLDKYVERYDLFVPITFRVANYVRERESPTIIDFVDSISHTYSELASNFSFPKSLVYKIDGRRSLDYERKLLDEFDHAFITTAADKTNITSSDDPSISVIPNGVRADLLKLDPSPEGSKPWIVFLGKMDYPPNEDAAIYFSDEVFPLIRDQCPAAKFLVVGTSPTEKVRRLNERLGVQVTGFVDDPIEYLQRARVVVAPLRYGGGIQNKILEAMALGKSVVTTPLGATGIHGKHRIHIMIANNSQEISAATAELFNDVELRREIGIRARKLINERYRWETIAPDILERVHYVLST